MPAVPPRWFGYFFDVVVLCNAVFIGISLESPEIVLLPLYNLELLLKLYTFGLRRFVRSAWNWCGLVEIRVSETCAVTWKAPASPWP